MSVQTIGGGFVVELVRRSHLYVKLGRYDVFVSFDGFRPAGKRIVSYARPSA